MADYTALVETGGALAKLLRSEMVPEPISNGEMISLCSPFESENNQLTLYLYHIEEDMQNGGQNGYYQYSRDVQRVQPTRLVLSFLITAHSKAPAQLREADQYRIIGAAVQALKDHPRIDKEFLDGSMAETGAEPLITVERPNFDQMIKIWNNTSTPYKLSFVCKVSGVSIDSKRERRVGRVTEVIISPEQKKSMPE